MKVEFLDVRLEDSIALITIDRPPLNIFNSQVYEELGYIFDEVSKDKETRAIVITGKGERAFCAGADVKEFESLNADSGIQYTTRNNKVREKLWNLPKPVICAINGLALGGGCVLAMLCDFRVASQKARLGLTEINMGIIGGTQFAVRMLPPGMARYLILSGEIISAEEAFRIGLVDKIVEPERVLDEAMAIAKKLARKSPLALSLAKKVMNSSYNRFLADGIALETEYLRILWASEDKNEGVRAFIEKREPIFTGK